MKDSIQFPPYGRMVADLEADITEPGAAPDDWRGPKDWIEWRSKVVRLINIVLWPSFKPSTRAWDGPAAAFMEGLTKADFELLKVLRPVLEEHVALGNGPIKQRTLFVIEDEKDVKANDGGVYRDMSVDKTLREYLAGIVDPAVINAMALVYLRRLGAKSGMADLELKRFLQRPRAYQMATIMGESWFDHAHAKSAVTPAMISGHCFQIAMGGVAAFYLARVLGLKAEGMNALAQHTVDGGDRRVFAGVHYPTDNVSSWIVALLVSPNVCPDTDGAQWLWQAITHNSRVYRELNTHHNQHPKSAIAPSMRLLKHIGANPGITVEDALVFATATG